MHEKSRFGIQNSFIPSTTPYTEYPCKWEITASMTGRCKLAALQPFQLYINAKSHHLDGNGTVAVLISAKPCH